MKLFFNALLLFGLIQFANGQSLVKNKDIIISLYETFNNRNFSLFYSKFADSVLVHFSNNQNIYITPNQIKASIDPQIKAFPDIKDTITQIVANKDWVSICVKHVGTHNDSLWSIPPSYKHVNYNVMEMYKLKNKKIVEIYVVEDFLGMYQQMGIIPINLRDLLKS